MLTSADQGSRDGLARENAGYSSTFWSPANLANLFPCYSLYARRKYFMRVLGRKDSSHHKKRVYRLARFALGGKTLGKQAYFAANLDRFEVSGRLARLA